MSGLQNRHERDELRSLRTFCRWVGSGVMPSQERSRQAQSLLSQSPLAGEMPAVQMVVNGVHNGVLPSQDRCKQAAHEVGVLIQRMDDGQSDAEQSVATPRMH